MSQNIAHKIYLLGKIRWFIKEIRQHPNLQDHDITTLSRMVMLSIQVPRRVISRCCRELQNRGIRTCIKATK